MVSEMTKRHFDMGPRLYVVLPYSLTQRLSHLGLVLLQCRRGRVP